MVAIVAIPLWAWQKRAAQNRELAAAIQSSTLFAKPVTVEASVTERFDSPLSREAETLRDAGLLTVEDEPVAKPAYARRSPAEPHPLLMRMLRPTTPALNAVPPPKRRLIPKDIAATREWQSFEDHEHRRSGWTVPVGTRELIELKSIERTGPDALKIKFSWKWKPNEVGLHFDITDQAKQSNARRKSNPQLSSDFFFEGTAELSRTSNGWVVKTITWDLEAPVRIYRAAAGL